MAPLLSRLAGALAWLAAALALYALGAAYATAWHGLALAAGALVLLPLLLAHWFTRAHRRLDPASRFAQNLPGIAALVAATALASIALAARGPLAFALGLLPSRHPSLEPAAGARLRALADLLRPAAPAGGAAGVAAPSGPGSPPSAEVTPARDVTPSAQAGSGPLPAEAGRLVKPEPPPEGERAAASASAGVAERAPAPPEATERTPAPPEATERTPAPSEAAERPEGSTELSVELCGDEHVYEVAALPTRAGAPDRIWASCLGPRGHVLEVRADGTLASVAEIHLPPPAPHPEAYVTDAAGADLDGDGAGDLLVGVHYLSERGGSRGGALLWARALADGRYGPLQRIGSFDCSAFEVADLDGKPGLEIVAVDYGNPFAPDPRGRLLVFASRGGRWQQASSMRIPREPEALALSDVDGDGRPDAVVQHDLLDKATGTIETVARVYPSRGLRFAEADLSLSAPAPPDRVTSADADLDGDGVRDDRILADTRRGVRLRRGRSLHGPLTGEAQQLTFPAPRSEGSAPRPKGSPKAP